MKENKKIFNYLAIAITIVFVFWLASLFVSSNTNASQEELDSFASCIAEKGAKFYGAFWCSHCQEQKAMFKNSSNIPYTECSQADGRSQTTACILAQIDVYPTWVFADGEKFTGTLDFDELESKTSCRAPK